MTTNHEFDRQLADWLHETSAHRVPDHVVDVLLVTRATRQRPWWSSLERWLPMDIPIRARTFVPNAPWRLLAMAALVAALVAGLLLLAGSRRQVPPPFGPARNGTIAFADVGDVFAVDALGGTPRLLIGGLTSDAAPTFWRDGTRLAFLRDTHVSGSGVALMVADADGSNVRQIVDLTDAPGWVDVSPDGRTLAMSAIYKGVSGLYLVDAAGTTLPRQLGVGEGEVRWLAWRPPTGAELVYVQSNAGDIGIYGVAADGTGRHLIKDLGVLDSDIEANLEPSLTPDGTAVVYAVVDGDLFHNHLLNLDTKVDRQLALGPAGGHELHGTVSPDGTKVLFHDVRSGTPGLQEMLAPLDGSAPAIAIGPPYPIVNGHADLGQEFSPDGRTVVIIQGRDREIRLVDAATGGDGQVATWKTNDLPGWQRLAP